MALQEERRRAEGIAASLQQPVYDQDLYGGATDGYAGYDRSIGIADTEEEMDEREHAVRRCGSLDLLCSSVQCCLFEFPLISLCIIFACCS